MKREPKRPRPREVASFLKHIQALNELADGLPPPPEMLSVPKRMQLVLEARALDVHEMRVLKPAKRYSLAVLFGLPLFLLQFTGLATASSHAGFRAATYEKPQ